MNTKDKIVSLEELKKKLGLKPNIKTVFTNGCFDILHPGHISYLESARELGDLLILGLNTDASVRSLKGEDRPVLDEDSRSRMLAALACVDYVVLFSESTPYDLIKAIKPNVLVKGGDYKLEDIVGRDVVENNGGMVKVIPFIEGYSTTSIIEKIKKS